LTFDPAIDFENPKDQNAKTSKIILAISIGKVDLYTKKVLTGQIDFA
jgi:hypothetical protein